MTHRFLIVAMAGWFLGFPATPTTADEPTGSALSQAEARQWVQLHNHTRQSVEAPELAWSTELAEHAQAWADELARTGKFEHRPTEGRWKREYGENLAIGFGREGTLAAAFRRFLDEKSHYDPEVPLEAETMPKIGHYTAIVWRGTTHVGAGRAVVQTGPYAGATITVTNYDPPGNRLGEKAY